VDPQVRTQLLLHPVDEQPADVVHVQVGQHHVGQVRKIDAGGLQSMAQLPRLRQVRVQPGPGVDEDSLAAAPHHDHVQRPIEHFRRQHQLVDHGLPGSRVGGGDQHLGWQM
jgi:hypothetical protein